MNFIIEQITTLIEKFDTKQFYQAAGALLICIALCCALLMYQAQSIRSTYAAQFNRVNKSRSELKHILGRKQQVKQQREQVQKILDEEPDFNLKRYFSATLDQFGIQYKVIAPETAPNPMYPEEFMDVTATGTLTNTTMQKLAQFLQAVEDNPRVHPTRLDITQEKLGTIEAVITIATLLPKEEG